MNELVGCERAGRTYGRGRNAVVAVHGVDCAVTEGDRIAVTGPSGSGKTTLMHLLAGLDQPTSGHVRRRAVTVGIVFQGLSLLPPLNIVENVALPLLIAGCDEKEAGERALNALKTVDLADLAERLPEEVSGGQAQRAAVARVLAAAPRLIIADEPTGQLDSAQAAHVMDLLVELATGLRAGLVVATHDTSVADRLTSRWEMRDGTLRSRSC
ncbi:ATP-binding cassette domain-containing protein [Streptosporangium sp. NPDC051023]|uniref:ABC transporter ATP-binding protein n=1 Tax=Streptosporangium sp. NPDC051023 TaxID=3155410 RepID=UPI0034503E92